MIEAKRKCSLSLRLGGLNRSGISLPQIEHSSERLVATSLIKPVID